jgi:hypothetical protein
MGAHQLDDLPDVSCKDSTRQHAVDGPRLSCKQQVGCPCSDWLAASAEHMAVDRGAADSQGGGDRADCVLPGAVHLLRHPHLVSGHHRRSATTATASVGRGQPGDRALADQVAFELGQGGEDVEDELAARGGGIDRLLEAAEPDGLALAATEV